MSISTEAATRQLAIMVTVSWVVVTPRESSRDPSCARLLCSVVIRRDTSSRRQWARSARTASVEPPMIRSIGWLTAPAIAPGWGAARPLMASASCAAAAEPRGTPSTWNALASRPFASRSAVDAPISMSFLTIVIDPPRTAAMSGVSLSA
eukprot:5572403-Prymnesium_polylepis.1